MHTGNTSLISLSNVVKPVYPRAYREHQFADLYCQCTDGLSPCIRGTQQTNHTESLSSRFIPVHTGNTILSDELQGIISVYPRAYGEHYIINQLSISGVGLSPCIRGTRNNKQYRHQQKRFIPVHTGNTRSKKAGQKVEPVYPRAYGEHLSHFCQNFFINGLSPCIRGTLTKWCIRYKTSRFIPVHTGNTPSKPANESAMPVYPRAYGEHVKVHPYKYRLTGLSPCIRGTLSTFTLMPTTNRFIPVHTGNTLNIFN